MLAVDKSRSEDSICDEDEAISWASQHVKVDTVQCVRQFPWSRVYKLNASTNALYLKTMPPQTTSSTTLLPELSARFPDNVPSIIASSVSSGLLLMREFDGARLTYDSPDEHLAAMLRTYARIQANCAAHPELLKSLPSTDSENQLTQLLEFFKPNNKIQQVSGVTTTADSILGSSVAGKYYEVLAARQALLQSFLSRARDLPTTINHGDFRLPHAAIRSNSSVILFDWDDANTGPAGLSLHGVFSGCAAPAMLLEGSDLGDPKKAKRLLALLNIYIDELVEHGYADKKDIIHGLGAAACAGVMQYLLAYSRYDFSGQSARKEIAHIFAKRLSNLLDLCDFLSVKNPDSIIDHARNYLNNGRSTRAEHMLSKHLWNKPNDSGARALYADLLTKHGDHARARRNYREVIEIMPNNADIICKLGDSLLRELKFDRAISQYRLALSHDPSNDRAAKQIESAFELRRISLRAANPNELPTIVVSQREFANGRLSSANRALATQLFREYGILVMENVFDKNLIEECKSYFLEQYSDYFENKRHKDALRIGDKRFQVTLAIEGAFNQAGLYGNPLVLSLMKQWLHKNFVFGSITGSTSLPGSKEQWLHKDHPPLFSSERENLVTPPFGVSVMIPLVDLNEEVGTTKVKKKSHFVSLTKSREMRSLSPYVKTGSCYFMDPRLSHKGEPNKSKEVRPILNALYHRRWYRDSLNYRNQPPIRITDAEFDKVPDNLKRLLKWTADPASRV